MQIAKRMFLFLAVNFLVMTTLMLIAGFFGIGSTYKVYGFDLVGLGAMCLLWGMGGAFISLAISRIMAKFAMGVRVIDPQTSDSDERWLVDTVYELSRRAGLPAMPEVGIYDSPELNAFATGPTKSRSLVAVSSGLLQRMDRRAVEGVLSHEVAHIANGDMVTMTLIQGVMNAFVMFLARILGFMIAQALRGDKDRDAPMGGFAYHAIVFVLEMIFMILGSMVVAWFSRYREYRADAGGANLGGRDKMIAGLESLQRSFNVVNPEESQAVATMKISGHPKGIFKLFSTHPPLEERIARLQSMGA